MSGSPFLTHVALREERVEPVVHPFHIPVLRDGLSFALTKPVTFLVGENGSGKSTTQATMRQARSRGRVLFCRSPGGWAGPTAMAGFAVVWQYHHLRSIGLRSIVAVSTAGLTIRDVVHVLHLPVLPRPARRERDS